MEFVHSMGVLRVGVDRIVCQGAKKGCCLVKSYNNFLYATRVNVFLAKQSQKQG